LFVVETKDERLRAEDEIVDQMPFPRDSDPGGRYDEEGMEEVSPCELPCCDPCVEEEEEPEEEVKATISAIIPCRLSHTFMGPCWPVPSSECVTLYQ
jgi:hypothetical protein